MLMNHLNLDTVPGRRARLHFSDDYYVERRIRDPERGGFKQVKSHVFWVDMLDGEPSGVNFSVLSQKLMAQLAPFLPNKRYMEYEFIISKEGAGFSTEYRVVPMRITPERPSG